MREEVWELRNECRLDNSAEGMGVEELLVLGVLCDTMKTAILYIGFNM